VSTDGATEQDQPDDDAERDDEADGEETTKEPGSS
jgi:hypothetical protein